MSVLLTIVFDLLVAEGEEKEGEDNKMLLHDMSITVIHFVWHGAVTNDKCVFLLQL